jgi:hypothetical protein
MVKKYAQNVGQRPLSETVLAGVNSDIFARVATSILYLLKKDFQRNYPRTI